MVTFEIDYDTEWTSPTSVRVFASFWYKEVLVFEFDLTQGEYTEHGIREPIEKLFREDEPNVLWELAALDRNILREVIVKNDIPYTVVGESIGFYSEEDAMQVRLGM